MLESAKTRPDLLLLLSLLLVILVYPALDHGEIRRAILGALFFLPIILASVRLSQIKRWVWPSLALVLAIFFFSVAATFRPNQVLIATKWGLLAGFFGLTVTGLFSYVKNASRISNSHLYTAVSIYLLIGMLWFAVYSAIDAFYPGAILHNSATQDRHTELLYFSLITLSTVGYGDVVPISGEVRLLAALEGVTGVLYVAITVALLVSSYRARDQSGST